MKQLIFGILSPLIIGFFFTQYKKEPKVLSPVVAFIIIPSPTHLPSPTTTPTRIPTKKPTPTPHPTTAPLTGQQLDGWFDSASRQYGVDRQKLWNLAVCESQLNPVATNKYYGGLYQYAQTSWQNIRRKMGRDQNPDLRYNAEEAINTAAFHISIAGFSAWPACSKKL